MPDRPPFVEYVLSRLMVLEMGNPPRFTILFSDPLCAKLWDPPVFVCDLAREAVLLTLSLSPTLMVFDWDLASAVEVDPEPACGSWAAWNGCWYSLGRKRPSWATATTMNE